MTCKELFERIERAIKEAAKNSYNDAATVPLGLALIDLRALQDRVEYIDVTLRVPAAEYVPAISEVFHIIDGTKHVPKVERATELRRVSEPDLTALND